MRSFDPVAVARNRAALVAEVYELVRILQNHSGVEKLPSNSGNFYVSDRVVRLPRQLMRMSRHSRFIRGGDISVLRRRH